MDIKTLVAEAHQNALEHGFYDTPSEFGTKLALIHSELSEALEESRANKPFVYYVIKTEQADGTIVPEIRTDYGDGNYDGEKPEGIAIELADAVIRIADLCGYMGIDLEDAIARKAEWNRTRPYKHGKAY